MPFPKGQNPNHPADGSTIKVEPIRDKKAIARIKKILVDRPCDLCLFTLGINTAYRANELLSLKVGQVKNLKAGEVPDLKQRKTHKYRSATLNVTATTAIQPGYRWVT
jgi:integrase